MTDSELPPFNTGGESPADNLEDAFRQYVEGHWPGAIVTGFIWNIALRRPHDGYSREHTAWGTSENLSETHAAGLALQLDMACQQDLVADPYIESEDD